MRQVSVLTPQTTEETIHSVPQSQTEQPGVGTAIGGVVGAALGMAGGFELGLASTALIPGLGPVLIFGAIGAALLGAGGAIAGANVGEAIDQKTTEGVPTDELFFYEDALRQGRSVVLALAENDAETATARKVMEDAGAESLDAARHEWWLGLRDAEQEHYRALGQNFETDEDVYRAGFVAALRGECRGKSADEACDCLKWWYPKTWDSAAFRAGYARGSEYWSGVGRSEVQQR